MSDRRFYQEVTRIAVPVALQSLLASSFSVVDQIMIGRLGSESIAGVGLGGKFASIYSVILGAVATAAGIMLAQYSGQKNRRQFQRSFFVNMVLAALLGAVCMSVCLLFPRQVMSVYTKDTSVRVQAAAYLRTYCLSFLPMAISSIAAVLLRCVNAASLPLAASFLSVLLNTGLNYLLIFGKGGFLRMGVRGAALASVWAQLAACAATVFFVVLRAKKEPLLQSLEKNVLRDDRQVGSDEKRRQRNLYIGILAPVLVCEFLWSLGENVYGAIYGNIGTKACAAMTMTGAVQGLIIGLLSGLSQAASIMIGKSLGERSYERAYADSKRLMACGLAGSLVLSFLLAVLGKPYVRIYNVDAQVQAAAYQILLVFALVSPVKVQNMILGGGIIRSGGKTKYLMWIDIIGTWGFGVPLGLLAAFVWKLPIVWVYFILSLEEVVRLFLSLVLFRSKRWMKSL